MRRSNSGAILLISFGVSQVATKPHDAKSPSGFPMHRFSQQRRDETIARAKALMGGPCT
jgi:hypothetical protein